MSMFDSIISRTLPLVPRPLVWRFASPYVAGASQAQALESVRSLNQRSMMATVDVLGEDVHSIEATQLATEAYQSLLDAIAADGLDANVSLKLTQLGLKVDRNVCVDNLRQVLVKAAEHGNFVRIDMEDSSCTDDTLEIYHDIRRSHPAVGVVLQAMLRRTVDDARELAGVGANVRICKGIYVEPAAVAYQDAERVRESFLASVEILLEGDAFVAIATHDEVLVQASEDLIQDTGLARERYEFQMLLGVRAPLRNAIVGRGHPLRVYVPFGEQWYAYSLRRLRENPAVAGHVVRALLRGEGWRRDR